MDIIGRSDDLRKVVGLIVFLLVLGMVSGCSNNDTNEVIKKLEEKYNMEFVINHAGGRNGNSFSNKYYFQPKDNSEIIFAASLKDGQLTDNYEWSVKYYELDKNIEIELSKNNIVAEVDSIYNTKALVHIAVNDYDIKNNKEIFIELFNNIYKKYNMDFVIVLYNYNLESYNLVSDDINTYPNVSEATFRSYNPKEEYTIVIENGTIKRFDLEV